MDANQQDDDPCQQPDSMQLFREFNTIFADRLERIDLTDGPDCIEVGSMFTRVRSGRTKNQTINRNDFYCRKNIPSTGNGWTV